MKLKARVGSDYKDVQVVFGAESDVRNLGRWRASKLTSSAVRDAIEFARLASKRWRYYRKNIPGIGDFTQLRHASSPANTSEYCLILIAKADWFSDRQALGLAQCRRTFCNNLVLEFLSVHPRVLSGADTSIRGIGSGLIYTLAAISESSGLAGIWGESTAYSASFYQRILNAPAVSDQFAIKGEVLLRSAKKFRTDVQGSLELGGNP